MSNKIAIVGGGPAGVFCALQICELLKSDFEITIFEKSSLLKTILPTGGGRCNLSFYESDTRELARNYPRGEKFLYSVFSRFNVEKTLEYFNKIGIETYKQNDNRIFPTSNSSEDLRNKLVAELGKHKNINVEKKDIKSPEELVEFDKIVVATGSKGGYELALSFGHTITPLKRALCGYVTKQKYPSGVVLKVGDESILFTHQGVSGPYIYKHSSVNAYEPFPRALTLPILNFTDLAKEIKKKPKKAFGNIVSEFIPKSLTKILVKKYEVQAAQISKKDIEEILNLTLDVTSLDSKGEIVTAGGVSLKEVNQFCGSKINNKLYFCGEILDIDGFCGGFNLQNCWSSAYCTAFGISNSLLS